MFCPRFCSSHALPVAELNSIHGISRMLSDGAVQSPAGDANKVNEKREILSFAHKSGCHLKGITTVHVGLHTLTGVICADVLGQDSNSVR